MKIWPLLFFLIFTPSIGGCTQPSGMYQKATIRVSNSQLCFSVADSWQARRTPPTIVAISVSKFVHSEWAQIWGWDAPLGPKATLHPDDCILYGERSADDASQQSPERLRPGERYDVSINSWIPNPSPRGDPKLGRMYGQYFCLRETTDSLTEVIEVPVVQGKTQWQLCN